MPEGVDVRIVTPMGAITVRVFQTRAPGTAGGFLKAVDAGMYSGAGFYRVVRSDNDNDPYPIQVVQGGILDWNAPFEPIVHESTDATGLRHLDGAVSLARIEPGTGSAAGFFICVGDQPALDFGGLRNPDGQGFAVFGRVVDGMDVVRRIHALAVKADAPHPLMAGQVLAETVPFLSVARSSERNSSDAV